MTAYIIGVDEVGLGAWAGPLYVCAVAVPASWRPAQKLTDSKEMTPAMREAVYTNVLQQLPMTIMAVGNEQIDKMGIRSALIHAHTLAIQCMLSLYPNAEVIVDGNVPLPELPQAKLIPKADALYPAVSAASVIAKVNRDLAMKHLHTAYPHYGFDKNAGYGVPAHQKGLKEHGVTPWHRKSYAPIKKLLERT